MLIGGIQTLTLVDYPDKVAAVVFTAGCNFRCGFCHNPQFVNPDEIKNLKDHFIPESKFFVFLESRGSFLDAVVISGGEPTMQPDLEDFIKKIKAKNLLVKLDTNGTNPELLQKLIDKKLIDYIAMDIKSSIKQYANLCETTVDTEKIKTSKDLILNKNIDHEFRTTVLKPFHNKSEIEAIGQFCEGARKFTLQNFRNQKTLNPKFKKYQGFSPKELKDFKKILEQYISKVQILA